jgi:hypothetical protein
MSDHSCNLVVCSVPPLLPIAIIMKSELSALVVILMMLVMASLYVMRRRSRLGKRQPKF